MVHLRAGLQHPPPFFFGLTAGSGRFCGLGRLFSYWRPNASVELLALGQRRQYGGAVEGTFLGSAEHHQPSRAARLYLTSCLKASTCHDFGNTGGRPGGHPPGVQRTSSATSASKFDNIGDWMGLGESPLRPFDAIEAYRTGVRRDSHQSGWRSSALRPGRRPSVTGRTTV